MKGWFSPIKNWKHTHATWNFTGKVNRILVNCQRTHFIGTLLGLLQNVQFWYTLTSHPVGVNGRNNIVVMTPMKFLPIEEFEKRQKSIDPNNQLAITSSMMAKFGFQVIKSVYYFWLALENQNQKANIIENKKRAIELKEKGNNAFNWEVYKVAEKYYSDGLQLNLDSR